MEVRTKLWEIYIKRLQLVKIKTRAFTRSKYISRVYIVLWIQLDLKWAFDIPTLFWEGSKVSMAAFERFWEFDLIPPVLCTFSLIPPPSKMGFKAIIAESEWFCTFGLCTWIFGPVPVWAKMTFGASVIDFSGFWIFSVGTWIFGPVPVGLKRVIRPQSSIGLINIYHKCKFHQDPTIRSWFISKKTLVALLLHVDLDLWPGELDLRSTLSSCQ